MSEKSTRKPKIKSAPKRLTGAPIVAGKTGDGTEFWFQESSMFAGLAVVYVGDQMAGTFYLPSGGRGATIASLLTDPVALPERTSKWMNAIGAIRGPYDDPIEAATVVASEYDRVQALQGVRT